MASEDVVIRAATSAATSTARVHHHHHGAGLSIPLIRVPIPNPLGWLPRPRILGGGGGSNKGAKGSSSRGHHHNTMVASASVATISETVLSGATVTLTAPGATAVLSPPPATSISLSSGASSLASPPPPMPPPPTKVPLKPASDVLCGALARAASQSTIHPLDTLKVRLQARARLGAPPLPPTASTALPAAKPASGVSKIGQLVPPPAATAPGGLKLPANVRDAAMGLASLYRGVFGAASGAGIAIGAYFAFYGAACNVMSVHCTDMAPGMVAFVSGGVAAVGSSFVKVPLAVCIRSVQAGVYPNVMVAARSIVAAAGPRGLFTGFLPTLLEDVPDMAIKFAAYESMRQVHSRFHKGRSASPQEDFAMGAVAGSLAAAATTPLDVIKTNMMCTAASRPSMLSAIQMVSAQGGGARAFFRGVGPRALSNGINSAVFFAFFEALRGSVAAAKKAQAEAAAQRALVVAQHGPDSLLPPPPRELPPLGSAMMGAPAVASLAAGGGALVLRRSTSMAAAARALASGSLAGAAASTGGVHHLMGADAGEGRAHEVEVPRVEEEEDLLVAHATPLQASMGQGASSHHA